MVVLGIAFMRCFFVVLIVAVIPRRCGDPCDTQT